MLRLSERMLRPRAELQLVARVLTLILYSGAIGYEDFPQRASRVRNRSEGDGAAG